jgi:hypothetical protein
MHPAPHHQIRDTENMSNEEFVRRAYAVAEARDIPAWIAFAERSTLRRARGSHGGSGQRHTRGGRGGRVSHLDAVASLGLGFVEGLVGAIDCARGALAGCVSGEPC